MPVSRTVFLVWLTLSLATVSAPLRARTQLDDFEDWDKARKRTAVNIAGAVAIGLWGVAQWDYGEHNPHFRSESWFGEDTREGGADKFGHLYTNYVATHGLAMLYQRWGYPRPEAARQAAWSAWGLLTLVEVGDAFSDYGFSYQDMVMNTLGAYAGYWMYREPELARHFDLRVEYVPTFDQTDVTTDYDGLKYIAALKFDGFAATRATWLRDFELHLGFYARGYSDPEPADRDRFVYVALGLNLTRLLGQRGHDRWATVFRYYQPPLTYIPIEHDLNE